MFCVSVRGRHLIKYLFKSPTRFAYHKSTLKLEKLQATPNYRQFHNIFKATGNTSHFSKFFLSAASIGTCLTTAYLFITGDDENFKGVTNRSKELLGWINSARVVEASSQGGKRSQTFNFIADVVGEAEPAVVYIEVIKSRGFGHHSGSCGSGFIVREDGLILTNAHVVSDASQVKVSLSDGQVFNGRVQSVDQVCDLATVKIDGKNLPTLPLGESKKVRPGEWVVAMGSPFSLKNTVTSGIVSNAGRETTGNVGRGPPMIQHDAVINVGNSGGPLINLDGEVIGINTLTLTSGISFALPSDMAVDFLNRAARVERRFNRNISPKRRYIGINMVTLTPQIITMLQTQVNFPSNIAYGILIHSVTPGSPAFRAGLQKSDTIIGINGTEARSTKDFYTALENSTKLTLHIVRGSSAFTVDIYPAEID